MDRLKFVAMNKFWKIFLLLCATATILMLFVKIKQTKIIDIWILEDNKQNMVFDFLNLPEHQCADEKLIILVHSSPGNFKRRTTIRNTWGSDAANKGIKVYFMLGIIENGKTQQKVNAELNEHQDFVQGNFVDSYKNLTYKHVMNFKFVITHCTNVAFLLKVDDDIFVNVSALVTFLELYNWKYTDSTNILCQRRVNHPVLRSGKWAVSEEDYSEQTYPTHCLGFAILYPRKTVSLLYSQFFHSKFFWIDDVFVSGKLAELQGVQHTDLNELICLNYSNFHKPFLFGGININEHAIYSFWNFTKQNPTKCSILDYLK